MTWLTWRQFRAQAITGAAVLAVLAIALGITGPHLAHLYASSGLATCQAHGNCGPLVTAFTAQVKASTIDELLFILCIGLLLAAPALIGVFWGAPLVAREIEAGTFRLAWSQSVTRARWLAVKLGLVGLASMATAGLLSLMVTWWAGPIDRAAGLPAGRDGTPGFNRFAPLLFDSRGIAPIGYALFAFVLGVTVGVLIRRTVPAMAVTLAIFVGVVWFAFPTWARPHLLPPAQVTVPLSNASTVGFELVGDGRLLVQTSPPDLPGTWVLSTQLTTPDGRPASTVPATEACTSPSPGQTCPAYVASLHLRQTVSYQPASRYWPLQWYETGIYLALTLALAGLCLWWIRPGHFAGLNIRHRTSQPTPALQSSP